MNTPPLLPADEHPSEAVEQVAAALRDIAAAVRELADRSDPDPLRLLRAEEVAALLALPPRTVRDRAAAGALPHRRFGKHYRFSRSDVDAIVRRMERTAPPVRRPLRAA